jgi:hypothetical protein
MNPAGAEMMPAIPSKGAIKGPELNGGGCRFTSKRTKVQAPQHFPLSDHFIFPYYMKGYSLSLISITRQLHTRLYLINVAGKKC